MRSWNTQRLKINLKINVKGKRDLHKWCPLCYCYERRCLVCWENDKDRQLSDRKETLVGREVTFETPLHVVVCYCGTVCYETNYSTMECRLQSANIIVQMRIE